MTERSPVVFINGLWLHASSWRDWVNLFGAYGYPAVSPGWPGHEATVRDTRKNPGALSRYGISEVMEHYARIATSFTARPVLVGHGFGGFLALTLAAEVHAAGVIAIDAVPVSAMPPAQDSAAGLGAVISRDEFRAVYGSALSHEESDRLYERWAVPAPERALLEPDMLAPRPEARNPNSSLGPVLLIVSGQSRRSAAAPYASTGLSVLHAVSDVVAFPDRGPSLVIDSGWPAVAETCLSWLDAHEL